MPIVTARPRHEKAERDDIFITVTPARARKEAEAAETRYRRRQQLSVLDEVPIAWKDLFDITDAQTAAALYCSTQRRRRNTILSTSPTRLPRHGLHGQAEVLGTCLFPAASRSTFQHTSQSRRPQHPPFAWRLLLQLAPLSPRASFVAPSALTAIVRCVSLLRSTASSGSRRVKGASTDRRHSAVPDLRHDRAAAPLRRRLRRARHHVARAVPVDAEPSNVSDLNSSCRRSWFATRRNRRPGEFRALAGHARTSRRNRRLA